MSWKKHFQVVPQSQKLQKAMTRINQSQAEGSVNSFGAKYSSYLPEVYAGDPNRVERYAQYDSMDQDSEVNASLDTIADFSTTIPEEEDFPFDINYKDDATEEEVEIIKYALNQWVALNEFDKRLWRIFRNTIKYGDQFFIRDPETMKLLWVDHSKVDKVIVNEAEGKDPEQYVIQDLDLNLQELVATNQNVNDQFTNFPSMWPSSPMTQGGAGVGSSYGGSGGGQMSPYSTPNNRNSRWQNQQNAVAVDAEHVVHLSLSEGMDSNWPFGNSVLESIYKVYKQKELLEDSVIIYRVQRAPERRVFYIDTGNLPTHKAMAFVERVKNEIHQRRIPNRTGGGTSIMDAAYNPLAIMEDYFFAQSAEGRGSKVETLPGGENLGEIDDLKYFNNKMMRGLRVPSSYLPTGPEDGTATYNDGRVGTAYIQEFRFSKYCKRLQNLITGTFDREFKLFLKARGIAIDSSLFDLCFHEPQNFAKFRQIEVDAAQIGVFQPLAEVPYFSKRFLMERFLNLSKDEILENERLWREENADTVKGKTGQSEAGDMEGGGLGDVGIRGGPGGEFDMGDEEFEGEEGLEGEEAAGGEFSPLGGPGEEEAGGEEEET